MEFYNGDNADEIRYDNNMLQNLAVEEDDFVDDNPENLYAANEDNARTTTEEDVNLLSRPIYNFTNTSSLDFETRRTLKTQGTPAESSSSQFKKTTGNTDDSRDKLFEEEKDTNPVNVQKWRSPSHSYTSMTDVNQLEPPNKGMIRCSTQAIDDSNKTASFGIKDTKKQF